MFTRCYDFKWLFDATDAADRARYYADQPPKIMSVRN
jgi:hypothetical protein